jgi:hypothetical protein
LLERVTVPDFEDNDLALIAREGSEGVEGGLFRGFAARGAFEPSFGFELAGEASPDGATVIECPVPKGSQAIVLGLGGWAGCTEQGHKSFMEDVFSFVMTESEGAAVEQQQGGFGLIELLTPAFLICGFAHGVKRSFRIKTPTARDLYRKMSGRRNPVCPLGD